MPERKASVTQGKRSAGALMSQTWYLASAAEKSRIQSFRPVRGRKLPFSVESPSIKNMCVSDLARFLLFRTPLRPPLSKHGAIPRPSRAGASIGSSVDPALRRHQRARAHGRRRGSAAASEARAGTPNPCMHACGPLAHARPCYVTARATRAQRLRQPTRRLVSRTQAPLRQPHHGDS